MSDYEEQKQMTEELAEALFDEVFVGDLHPMHIQDCLNDCALRLERETGETE